jgi:hypothetical protein
MWRAETLEMGIDQVQSTDLMTMRRLTCTQTKISIRHQDHLMFTQGLVVRPCLTKREVFEIFVEKCHLSIETMGHAERGQGGYQ